jgi:Holliday junction resolvase RusA-like endonuclease
MADNRSALKVWEQCVHVEALRARPRGKWCRWLGPVAVHVTFRLPRPKTVKRSQPHAKPDLDKLVRGCMDPISGVLFNDDAQIVSLSAGKSYCASGEQPGASITVRSMEPSS